jgi:hypothetical protein
MKMNCYLNCLNYYLMLQEQEQEQEQVLLLVLVLVLQVLLGVEQRLLLQQHLLQLLLR